MGYKLTLLHSSNSKIQSENYGSFSSGGGSMCCPLVVDPLTFISLLGFIGLAAYFLNDLIAMSNLMAKRKKRGFSSFWDKTLNEGKVNKISFFTTS